jgi:two-component system, LytTR family, response regulator
MFYILAQKTALAMNTLQPIKTLIVDDETAARELLAGMLHEDSDIEVVAQVTNAADALAAVAAFKPELIFLDIEMPDKNGLQLAQELRSLQLDCHIVFVTAFNQYAIQAFETAAFDYLLKPIQTAKLHKTISRLKSTQHKIDLGKRLELLNSCLAPEKIRFNAKTGFIMLDPREIVFAQADGNYTLFQLNGEATALVSLQLGKVEGLLPISQFLRVNRSVLVNKRYISSFNRVERILRLLNGGSVHSFRVSREALKVLK